MGFNIVVAIKQVPDASDINDDAMTPEGTVNRAALPAIVNPDDLNALEEALTIKEQFGGFVTVISMGPPSAQEALRECYFRGADKVILLSDKKFSGADTLATSYTLKCAIEKIGRFDLVLCGRQATDGDTAQVGPQLAEKLGINQITNVCQIKKVSDQEDSYIVVKRETDHGQEVLKTHLPVLLTVARSTNLPRSARAKRILAFKNVEFHSELDSYSDFLEWNMLGIKANSARCGLNGSPTKVKKIDWVVLKAKQSKKISNTDQAIEELIRELKSDHILG